MDSQLNIFDDPNDAFNQEQSFKNTIGLKGNVLKSANKNCKTQESEILEYFRKQPEATQLGPSQVWQILFEHTGVPITSIRRAMSNLTNGGFLEKLVVQQIGIYGKPEYFWRLISETNQII